MKATTVYFFPSGVTACCDEKGQQIGELQVPWITLWINYMKLKGYDPMTLNHIQLPDGLVKLVSYKEEDGSIHYSWQRI